jgi:glycosyltransferase involved in cell wall biosynthesis
MLPVRFLRPAALDYLEYDASFSRWLVGVAGTAAGALLWAMPDKTLAFRFLSRVHRSGGSDAATALIERRLARATARERSGHATGLWSLYEAHTKRSLELPHANDIVKRPLSLLGYRVLVLKSATEDERGVIVIDYSYIFPLFAALFDVQAIARRYHIVLEPSWRGLCTADILSYSRYDFPVFVESIEPRDIAFIQGLGANFRTVPIAANWWVDHRLVKPAPGVERDIDVIMVAAWSGIKRHWRFFRVLAGLRERGHQLRVALVGYKTDRNRTHIEDDARALGVRDQIEFHEGLTLQQVGALLARSKTHVLWSRKEGANRAIVEALFADVPIIVRSGLSYGHEYPYVNPATGRFADEHTLADTLLEMLAHRETYRPRAWAIENMSCQRATEILEDSIRREALKAGEPWTRNLAVKTVHLESQRYWDPEDMERFKADYAFLASHVRSNGRA